MTEGLARLTTSSRVFDELSLSYSVIIEATRMGVLFSLIFIGKWFLPLLLVEGGWGSSRHLLASLAAQERLLHVLAEVRPPSIKFTSIRIH